MPSPPRHHWRKNDASLTLSINREKCQTWVMWEMRGIDKWQVLPGLRITLKHSHRRSWLPFTEGARNYVSPAQPRFSFLQLLLLTIPPIYCSQPFCTRVRVSFLCCHYLLLYLKIFRGCEGSELLYTDSNCVEKETCFACYFSHIFVPPRPFQFLQGGPAAPLPLRQLLLWRLGLSTVPQLRAIYH